MTTGSLIEQGSQPDLQASSKLARIRDAIAEVTHEIGVSTESVRVVGASKAQSISTIRAFAEAGLRLCGENYLQEALPKLDALKAHTIEWHFIGHVQSNKAKLVAKHFNWVQTVHSFQAAMHLNAARSRSHPHDPLNCCIQVNIDEELQKAGVFLPEFKDLVAGIGELHGLRLRGVMAIPAPYANLSARMNSFERVKKLFDSVTPPQLEFWDTISVGMSDDYLTAIRCGANLVRLGTVLFGPRSR